MRRTKHFNSRPSARGDVQIRAGFLRGAISIHAPPRGATAGRIHPRQTVYISIHAPPRGATVAKNEVLATGKIFQFTPLREGRRGNRQADSGASGNFNSRPSARGDATLGALLKTEREKFQFTPLREGRLPGGYTPGRPFIFQFTPLREGRLAIPNGGYRAKAFQFTPLREGRQADAQSVQESDDISIHAPPRGATPAAVGRMCGFRISIHAPPRGATDTVSAKVVLQAFQFTPLREGRQSAHTDKNV